MTTSNYPVTPGYKAIGAAEIAARIVDRDPERRLNTWIAITVTALLATPMVGDEITTIQEGVLYVRPRISELVNLGIVVKGPTRPASICGKQAAVILPSNDLLDMVVRRELQLDGSDDDALWAAVGSMILDRVEEEKRRRTREASEAVEAMGPLKAPRSDRRAK